MGERKSSLINNVILYWLQRKYCRSDGFSELFSRMKLNAAAIETGENIFPSTKIQLCRFHFYQSQQQLADSIPIYLQLQNGTHSKHRFRRTIRLR